MGYLLHHLLSKHVVGQPGKEAVRMDGTGLTYEQLDRLTNQVARTLRSLGLQRGDRVGIYVNKSLASVIAVFGIMKAGGVYVPLDPGAPAKRLAYITRDCGIKVLLTSPAKLESLAGFFQEGTFLETVLLLEAAKESPAPLPKHVRTVDWNEIRAQSEAAPEPAPTIETDLAYILYTSGSTGNPKGVMISHRTILTFINWCQETFRLTPEDRVTSHAPLQFDLSTFDLYATIKAGGTIVLVRENLSALPVLMADLIQNERITVTYLVPSVLSLMVSYGKLGAHDFSALRAVLFAGEVFPIKHLRRLMEAIPHALFYNLYGPTETNVCMFHQVRPEDVAPDRTQPAPIGQACANMEVFAIDEHGRPVSEPGQEGELWARGSCVAQGYWGDPDKTSRSFAQNPLNPLYPELAYRTGDIVTLAPDRKNWIFMGRRDHMIKSRGYRIELGEIESAFHRHEQVKEAAVVAIPDDLLGNRICAFVVLAEGSHLTPKELEVFCSRQVPKYMVPERTEVCDQLPKTSSGKTDRTELAARAGGKTGVMVRPV